MSKKDRIKFSKKGVQRDFILKTKEASGLTSFLLSKKLGIGQRALADWTREKFNMSYVGAKTLSKLAKVTIPDDHIVIEWKKHLKKIGKVGGKNRIKIYGRVALNEEYRNDRWKVWWNKTGQYKKKAQGFQSIIKIKIPRKNELLAEFVGIMLGDGGVNQYHIGITLSSEEKQYILFVNNVIKKLFAVIPKKYKVKNAKAVRIVVNRKELVDFCQEIGLVKGNKVKQQIDIPKWIKNNREFSLVCVRGLIDTDGCFYNNSYIVNGKKYSYFKICFTSASALLIKSVHDILVDLGLRVIVSKTYAEVRIVDSKSALKYIREIGSNNQKHLAKIAKWKISKNMLE